MKELESGPIDITDTVSQTQDTQTFFIQLGDEKLVMEDLENQYINLNNLGNNLLEDYEVSDDVFQEIIEYVNDTYLPIVNIDVIYEAPNQVQTFGRFIYEFVCVDMLNVLLPRVLSLLNLKDCDDLKRIELYSIKSLLLRAVQMRMENLQKIIKEASIDDAKYELLKFTYYIDLLDNDIENLHDKLIIPMIEKYDMFLNSINPH